jgi:hypothetical protein
MEHALHWLALVESELASCREVMAATAVRAKAFEAFIVERLGAAGLEAAEQSLPSPQLTAPPRREPEREIEQANQQSTKPRTTPAGMVSPSPNNNTHFYEQQHLLGLTPGHPSGDFDLPSTTLLTTSRPTSMTKSRKNCQNGFGGGATLSTVSMSWQQPLGDDRQGLDGGKPRWGRAEVSSGGR